jgi:hypothetical protein
VATYDFEKIYSVKKNAEGRLLAIPGVHGVGLGAKYVGGERTREPAIMVFLENKKPASAIPPHEMIPPEIDGVKTDVVQSTKPRLMGPDDSSRHRPLVGGSQIQGGGSLRLGGTLGCIARINGPIPTIVGITNHHVVGSAPKVKRSTLTLRPFEPNAATFTGSNMPGTLIIVEWSLKTGDVKGPLKQSFYSTTKEDDLVSIAQHVADNVTLLSAGVNAAAVGNRVTFTAPGADFEGHTRIFGPSDYDEEADLKPAISGREITLTGKAANNYGIFTNWNSGGLGATEGVFTPVRKGSSLAQIAIDIAAAVNKRGVPGITGTATGLKVTINGTQQVECHVSTDINIGQPTASFCSDCCRCCRNQIGFVRDSRIDLDAALIELDAGLEYRAEIEEIGIVTGTKTYSLIDMLSPKPILAFKRGATTGRTIGWLFAIDLVGESGDFTDENGPQFLRYYNNAMKIKSVDGFIDHGDSGSALVNEKNEVIGILFGGSGFIKDGFGLATPIAEIEKAFDLSVLTATAPGQVSTVPATQGHAFSIVEREPLFVDALRDVERELTASPEGRELAEVGRRHAHEVVQLVNHNRRVGTVWRRNGGPEIVQTALTMAQAGEKDLPRQFNGRPLVEFLRKMQAILERYGSAQLATDLRRYGPRIIELTKFDYPQLLVALKAAQ